MKSTVSVPYGSGDAEDILSFDVWSRSIWAWCCELLHDQRLIREFRWNAERLFRFNGTIFERFFDEPWTADAWWNFQVSVISI